jgi:hypothetical protein
MPGEGFQWSSFADLGGIAGFVSLLWQTFASLRKRSQRAKLHVLPFEPMRDLRHWAMNGGPMIQKVVTLEVTNVGGRQATACTATANVLRQPDGVRLTPTSFPLQWAGTKVEPHDTGSFPVDIGRDQHQRLDVIFARNTQSGPGCWLAVPIALAHESGVPQCHLPPGEYGIEVVLRCENGDGCNVPLTIQSPDTWDNLHAKVG